MSASVAVSAPLIVAALVNWNDIVKVIDAVRRSGLEELLSKAAIDQPRSQVARSFTGVFTATVSIPFPSAATITGAITPTPTS